MDSLPLSYRRSSWFQTLNPPSLGSCSGSLGTSDQEGGRGQPRKPTHYRILEETAESSQQHFCCREQMKSDLIINPMGVWEEGTPVDQSSQWRLCGSSEWWVRHLIDENLRLSQNHSRWKVTEESLEERHWVWISCMYSDQEWRLQSSKQGHLV